MQKLRLFLLMASCLASTAVCSQEVVVVYENAPKIYPDPQGKPAGLFIELLDEIEPPKPRRDSRVWPSVNCQRFRMTALSAHTPELTVSYGSDCAAAEGGFNKTDSTKAEAIQFLWAALDCTSGFTIMPAPEGSALVLGESCATQLRAVRLGESCLTAGWPILTEGRKRHSGSAV